MSMEDLLDQLKRAGKTMLALKNTILEMCDQMDSTDDIIEKEKIRLAILDTEVLLNESESAYNEILEQIRRQ